MPATAHLSTTDRALIDALAAWGDVEALPLLRRLGAQRAKALAGSLMPAPPADRAIARLRQARDAQLGPDPARVHPSWYVRALQEETPAVRRAVVAGMDEPLRDRLMRGLGLEPADLSAPYPADPAVVEVARALWTERLVGDVPPGDDDPPAIRALTTRGHVATYRLLRLCGLAKRALIPDPDEGFRPRDANRLRAFRDRPGDPADPRLVKLAAGEWAASEPHGRHRLAGFGLATIGRLLATADAYRVRWALQHVPYPIAKSLRVAASRPEAAVRAVLALEGRLLERARERLVEEGRTA